MGAAGLVELLVDKVRSLLSASGGLNEMSYDTDIVEAAVCALANVLSLHAPNANKLVAVGGLDVLISLLRSNVSVDLLDSDREAQIQANAANALANTLALFRGEGRRSLLRAFFHSLKRPLLARHISPISSIKSTLSAVILLCVASLSTTRCAAALLLGNLALDPELRSELGHAGAIEALWSTSKEGKNRSQCATALWALSNLVWSNSANQERCGQFLEHVIALAAGGQNLQKWNEVKTRDLTPSRARSQTTLRERPFAREPPPSEIIKRSCALCLVANTLYFNDSNRVRVESLPNVVEMLIAFADYSEPSAVREPALRCLASLTATDRGAKRVALAQAETGSDVCRTLVYAAGDKSTGGGYANVRRLGAATLTNICSLTDARHRMSVSPVCMICHLSTIGVGLQLAEQTH